MSVLTGDIFADMCQHLWGAEWKTPAARRFKKNRKTMTRYAAKKHKVSKKVRAELLTVVDERIAMLEAFKRDFR